MSSTKTASFFPCNMPINASGQLTNYAALMLFFDGTDDAFYRQYLVSQFGEKAVKACIYHGFIDSMWHDDECAWVYVLTDKGADWIDKYIDTILELIDDKYFMPDRVGHNAAHVITANLLSRTVAMKQQAKVFTVVLKAGTDSETFRFDGPTARASAQRLYNMICLATKEPGGPNSVSIHEA